MPCELHHDQLTALFRSFDKTSLVHPLSPRGKLVYRGLEGLAATNRLIDVAVQQQQQQNNKNEAVVLRDEIYRVALSEQNVLQFQKTAVAHDEICEWVHPSNMDPSLQLSSDCLGYLKLTNGCKVIHIPTYLALLWRACEKSKRADWKLVENDNDLRNVSSSYDTVVLAAGSGLFESLIPQSMLPIQLVRGQSAIIKRPEESLTRSEAILCGKYISPLPQEDLLLIGATHEFKQEPLGQDDVVRELRERTEAAVPYAWIGSLVQMTEGFRVQSQRGEFGRLPILGKCESLGNFGASTWLFTGLSSRGLLYHGLFGELLSRAILVDEEDTIRQDAPEVLWWKQT